MKILDDIRRIVASLLSTLLSIVGPKSPKLKKIAIMVDGPNVLRKEFHIDLKKVKEEVSKMGEIRVAIAFLDQYASDKLIEAVANQGFQPMISPTDVDVNLAVETIFQAVLNPEIDTLVVLTRDADLQPVLRRAKEYGKETIVMGADICFGATLRNTADKVIFFNPKEEK